MRAAIVDRAGAMPRFGNFDEPTPQDGETRMQVLAAGIHPVVRSLVAGTHYGSDEIYPRIPGIDCVARGDDGVPRYAGFIRGPWGTIAERVVARMGLPLPDGADPAVIAGSLNPGLSSWLPLTARAADAGSLGTVLILGATGVAGRIAVQNALALGAERVIGVGRDADRLVQVEQLGGVGVTLQDGPSALRRCLNGIAPTLILDFVWGAAAELTWEALSGHGLDEDTSDILHVEIGAAAGARAALPAALLRSRRITLRGSGAGSASLSEILAQLPVFMGMVASGQVRAPIRRFSLADIEAAWAYTGPDRAVVVPHAV